MAQSSSAHVTISESAVRRVRALAEAEGAQDMMLRVAVGGGGCSGFQYSFSFDDSLTAEDKVFERDGVKVVVDEISLEFLAGSEVDFVDDLMGQSFQVNNPNAVASCGCGTSFTI